MLKSKLSSSLKEEFPSDLTLTEIADKYGVTIQCISRILLRTPGQPSGMERRKKRAEKRKKEEQLQIFTDYFAALISAANKRGIKKISPKWIGNGSCSRHFLYMEDRLCRFSINRHPDTSGVRSYWYHTAEAGDAEIQILLVGDGESHPQKFFIWPSALTATKRKVYIPVDGESSYHVTRRTKIDLTEYEDRWDLVGGSKRMVSLPALSQSA